MITSHDLDHTGALVKVLMYRDHVPHPHRAEALVKVLMDHNHA